MISSELGRFSPPATVVNVPSSFARKRAPVFGIRRRPRGARAVVRVRRTREVALREGEQRASPTQLHVDGQASAGCDVGRVDAPHLNDTTLPFCGRCGTGPASAR